MTTDQFAGLHLSIARDDQLDEVFALRHAAYLAEGAIAPRRGGQFIDRYDLLRSSALLAVTDGRGGPVVGSLRFAVQPASSQGISEYLSAPEFLVFPDLLGDLMRDDRSIASGARFSIAPGHPRRCQVALLLVLAQLEAARAVGAKWGIATARGGHLHFYRRLLQMEPLCEPRPMPGLEYSYSLLAGDVDQSYANCPTRFPQACRAQLAETVPSFAADIRSALPSMLWRDAA